jgi:RNA recognition motif-containing protein
MKLYVGNLSFDITERTLRELFEPFGTVSEVKLIMVKFQQRYQMRNRILSKAVPALEFCSFCSSQNCVLFVRQFLGV